MGRGVQGGGEGQSVLPLADLPDYAPFSSAVYCAYLLTLTCPHLTCYLSQTCQTTLRSPPRYTALTC